MDQTPTPFEYLSGWTYGSKGSKTVWAKAERSGWDKRQATIQLTVLADGIMLKLWVFLRGKGEVPDAEKNLYDPRVRIIWNEKTYANEETTIAWISEQLIPAFQEYTDSSVPRSLPGMVALDAAAFHRTDAVLSLLRQYNITPSLIPGGCTSLIQVLDVVVNRPFKDALKESLDRQLYELSKVKSRKIMDLVCTPPTANLNVNGAGGEDESKLEVDGELEAWEKMQEEYFRNMIQRGFRSTGISLPIDGTADSKLSVKGLTPEELIIGPDTEDIRVDQQPTDSGDEVELGEDDDENENVYFLQFGEEVIQVGRPKT
ncbi:hypothetical protein K440DRAFT_640730 [Wilcoxina mikolae CBS 423.85]|nr:hypothetical protein K440DRAFT_640730 [Wilcoxina mikolae CBS 423.85]